MGVGGALGLRLVAVLAVGRQELVERSVEKANRDRPVPDHSQQVGEVALLGGGESGDRLDLFSLRFCEHQALHQRKLIAEELMFGAAEADSLGTEPKRRCGVLGVVCIGAHPQAPDLVGPPEQYLEFGRWLGGADRHGAAIHVSGAPVDRHGVAFTEHHLTGGDRAGVRVDAQRRRSADSRSSGPPCDNRGMRCQPAVRCDHRGGREQGRHVCRARLGCDEDDVLALACERNRAVARQNDLTDRSAGRGR